MRLEARALGENTFSPSQYQRDYTEYYEYHNSDSPERSRRELITQLLSEITEKLQTQATVILLDVGAGKQILESEIMDDVRFQGLKDCVRIITLDIASLKQVQLLAPAFEHVQANGAELPFSDTSFDIIFSSMAIDFMPREEAFSELKRVLKSDGSVLINFHHPDLIKVAQAYMQVLENKLRSAQQKVKHGSKSSNLTKHTENLRQAAIAERDLRFVLNDFPHLVFQSTEEIILFLSGYFGDRTITVTERTKQTGTNGWYSTTVR